MSIQKVRKRYGCLGVVYLAICIYGIISTALSIIVSIFNPAPEPINSAVESEAVEAVVTPSYSRKSYSRSYSRRSRR